MRCAYPAYTHKIVTEQPRYLVVKSTIGAGLGDRIRAVLSAILYAKRSGRGLHVMWDDGLYGPDGENIFPRLFDLRGVKQTPIDLNHAYTSRPAFWRGELRHPMKVLYWRHGPEQWNRREVIERFSFDQTRLDYDEEVLVMWEFDQFGKCCRPTQSWAETAFVNALAREHLAPAGAVREAIDAFRSSRFRPQMIGVHVRLTHEAGSGSKRIDESRYHGLIRRIRRRYPEAGIFLATDNSQVQARFQARYGDALVTTDKWFASAGEPLHLADGRPDPLQNAVEALLDIFLLASCQHLIFPGSSSFSLTASYFREASPDSIYPLRPGSGTKERLRRVRAFFNRTFTSKATES